MRGALLGLLATFAGMILFTAPESLFQLFKVPLPGVLASQPGLLVRNGSGSGDKDAVGKGEGWGAQVA